MERDTSRNVTPHGLVVVMVGITGYYCRRIAGRFGAEAWSLYDNSGRAGYR